MQSEDGARDATPQQSALHIDDLLRPFSDADTSSFVHVGEGVRETGEASAGWAPRQVVQLGNTNAPSSFHPASSSHDDLDSLSRHAARHAEHLKALRNASSSFSRRYNRFAPSRAEVLLLRSRVGFEWTVSADQRRFVSDSHEAFYREATAICESLPPEYSTAKLSMLLAQVARDHKRQAEHLVKTYDTETQLSNAEYALQKKEYGMAQAAQRIADVLSQVDLPNQGGSEASTAPSVVVDEEIPPLVQNYFDKAGDVRLERERIMELEMEHREEREQRIFQEDQDITLAMTEDEFEENFNKQLAEAENALAEAIRKSENAKQVCLDSNLDPERYRHTRLDPGAASDHSISDPEVYERHESPLPTVTPNGLPSPLTGPFGDLGNVQSMIDELLPGISEPIQVFAPASSLSQGLSPNRRHEHAAPLGDRIRGWMDNVTDEARDTNPRSLSRSKSSEMHAPPIVLEERQDGTWRINKAASISRRQLQRQESQHNQEHDPARATARDRRPKLVKRPSSESKILVLPSWEGSYQDAVESIRSLQTTKL